MQAAAAPSFDEWVEYCFTQGYADFHADHGCDTPEAEAVRVREDRFVQLQPLLLGQYMSRLFKAPAFIANRYSDDQIADAVWFLFGVGSDYFHQVRYGSMSQATQVDVISAVATVYSDLFDRVCCKRGSDPDGDYTDKLKVDSAVHMIWDMDRIEGTILFPEKAPHLVEPAFEVLESVLAHCRTSTCLASALHGLWETASYHSRHDTKLAQRAVSMADRFLSSRRVAAWIREYARSIAG